MHLTCGEAGHLYFISLVSVYPAVEVIRTSPSTMKDDTILETFSLGCPEVSSDCHALAV